LNLTCTQDLMGRQQQSEVNEFACK
jgi:hypothetical protein